MEIDRSDLEKIHDALDAAKSFFVDRDTMNAKIHLAKETRLSPITSLVLAEFERVQELLAKPHS